MDAVVTIRDALRAERKRRKVGVAAFEAELGFPNGGLKAVIRDKDPQVPSLDKAEKIADALGLELYLGPPRKLPAEITPLSFEGEEFSPIAAFNDIQASGGGGMIPGDQSIVDQVAFRTGWLRERDIDPSRAALMQIRGTSMQPTIMDKAMVMIDLRDQSAAGKPMLFRRDDELLIKRLTRVDHGLVIVADNHHDFPPEFVPASEATSVAILGRAVWSGRDIF